MEKGIYYKYRSLQNFENFVDIIVNQRLYAAYYSDMNDAMEGVYYSYGLAQSILKGIKDSKDKFRICSLSKNRNEPLLWGHYADGSRGINIGLAIAEDNLSIEEIKYDGTPKIKKCITFSKTAKKFFVINMKAGNMKMK